MITKRQWMFGTAATTMLRARGAAAAGDALPPRLARIEAEYGGRLGVAVLDTATGQVQGHRLGERFPMCSTFKAPLTACVLARVDAGRERLDRPITIRRQDILAWSPVVETKVGQAMTIAELCAATMTISDNAAANLLLDTVGGPAGLTAWLRRTAGPSRGIISREMISQVISPMISPGSRSAGAAVLKCMIAVKM